MLTELAEDQFKNLYLNDVYRDFPESEIKPWQVVYDLYKSGSFIPLGYFENGELKAYALLIAPKGNRAILLDYLAVMPQYRNSGIGSAVLKELCVFCSPFADTILIESEYPDSAPDSKIAARRLGFYRRSGAALTSTQVWLFGVRFLIFALSCGNSGITDAASAMESIYRVSVPKGQYDSVVEIFSSEYSF